MNFVIVIICWDSTVFCAWDLLNSTRFLTKIAGDIMRMDTVMCDSVTPKERLVVTLRYLASVKPHSRL